MSFLFSKLAGPIFAALALLFFAGFIGQTVAIHGFLWWEGLKDELKACQDLEEARGAAEQAAEDRIREEGRLAGIAEGERLRAAELARQADLRVTIGDLEVLVSQLRNRPPPRPALPGQPSLPTLPPVAADCSLDPAVLGAIRDRLNQQRGVQ